jgi:hypothetical protein
MTTEDLDELLLHAAAYGEAVLHVPPDGWELVRVGEERPRPVAPFPGARWNAVKMVWEAP